MTQSATARKAALRALSLRRRAGVDEAAARRFAQILPAIAREALDFDERRSAALYAPVRGEPDCSTLTATLRAAGWRILLPCVTSRALSPLVFRAYEPGETLVPGKLAAIPEPPASRPAETPDVVFVPCAAFDRRGARIGFGRGFYDITLEALRAAAPTAAIGIAYAVQEVDEVPIEPHDQLLDFILTEAQTIACARLRKSMDASAFHR